MTSCWPFFLRCGRATDSVCGVCQHPCALRSCRCTHLHAECAVEMVRFAGPTCAICGHSYRTWWLPHRPEIPEEAALVVQQQEVAARRRRALLFRFNRGWNATFWKLVRRTMRPQRPSNVCVALTAIAQPDYRASFVQRALDGGLTATAAEGMLADAYWLNANYDELPLALKRRMRRCLRTSGHANDD